MSSYIIGGRLIAGGGKDAGEITVRAIPASSHSTILPLNAAGDMDIDVTLPMTDPVTGATVDLPNELIPGRDFIGIVENGVIVEAGPIWGDPLTWPHKSRIVASGLWSYFDHRYVLPVLAAGQLPRDVTSKWTGLSLRTIVKRLVQQACAHPNSGLPIDYEPDYTGTHEREYPGANLKPVGEALTDLTNVEGGPEIRFRPKFTEDRRHVRWELVTGDPELTQSGTAHYWDVSVPDAHASVETLDRDGTKLTSRDFQTGATLRNLMSNSSLREEVGTWVAGGANGTLTRATRHSASPVPGVTTGTYTTWTGNSGLGQGGAYYGTGRVAVKPGETYRISLWVRANVAKALRLRTQIRDEDGGLIDGGFDITTVSLPANTWQRVSATFTTPADAATITPFIYPQATVQWAAGNTLYTLAWSVTEGIADPPYDEESVRMEAIANNPALTDAGFPLLESVTARSSITLDTTLQAYANESVARGSGHLETWTLSVRRDKTPALGTYWPGDYARVRVGPNPRIPAGTYDVRILSVQFGKSGRVTVGCTPQQSVSGYPIPSSSRNWFRDRLRALNAAITEANRGK